jgi:hypothetical protein
MTDEALIESGAAHLALFRVSSYLCGDENGLPAAILERARTRVRRGLAGSTEKEFWRLLYLEIDACWGA